jgi:3-hydroxyanthranilate 3,4-dioxygenase
MGEGAPQPIDFDKWLEGAKAALLPPVCNKLIYGGQLKVMAVGGPNVRSDYHMEAGEELFYQVKGDMVLKVLEHGVHKDILIREGELFLLPPRIPHSPQRFENTIGLVVERERDPESEIDCMRWYVPGTTDTLYEEFFHCHDLGVQLAPVIERYRSSEMAKTGRPSPTGEGIVNDPPLRLNPTIATDPPKPLDAWLADNADKLRGGYAPMWSGVDFEIAFVGSNAHLAEVTYDKEALYFQLQGSSTLTTATGDINLPPRSMVLLPPHTPHSSLHTEGSVCMRLTWHVNA